MAFTEMTTSALAGGIVGAVLTLLGQGFLRWCWRPDLLIVWAPSESGCLVRTQAGIRIGNTFRVTAEQNYLRLSILNKGWTFAKNTSVCVTEIAYRPSGVGERWRFDEEVFDLKTSLAGDRAVFNLASSGHRFVDLFHVEQPIGQAPGIAFDFTIMPIRLAALNFGPGDYAARVFVSAENAPSVRRDVRWSWDGTLAGLTFTRPWWTRR
jgi:hypothetical protein